MAQPKLYASRAEQQKAYRERQGEKFRITYQPSPRGAYLVASTMLAPDVESAIRDYLTARVTERYDGGSYDWRIVEVGEVTPLRRTAQGQEYQASCLLRSGESEIRGDVYVVVEGKSTKKEESDQ